MPLLARLTGSSQTTSDHVAVPSAGMRQIALFPRAGWGLSAPCMPRKGCRRTIRSFGLPGSLTAGMRVTFRARPPRQPRALRAADFGRKIVEIGHGHDAPPRQPAHAAMHHRERGRRQARRPVRLPAQPDRVRPVPPKILRRHAWVHSRNRQAAGRPAPPLRAENRERTSCRRRPGW